MKRLALYWKFDFVVFISIVLCGISLCNLFISELGPIKNAVTCSMTIVHRFIVRVTIKVISFCHLEKWFIPRISCLCRTIYGLPFSIISLYIGCRDTIIFEIVITKLQLHMIKVAFEFTHNRHIISNVNIQLDLCHFLPRTFCCVFKF